MRTSIDYLLFGFFLFDVLKKMYLKQSTINHPLIIFDSYNYHFLHPTSQFFFSHKPLSNPQLELILISLHVFIETEKLTFYDIIPFNHTIPFKPFPHKSPTQWIQ